jgi:hypothetical protein
VVIEIDASKFLDVRLGIQTYCLLSHFSATSLPLQSYTAELTELNKSKVQVQREFEAFKELAMQVWKGLSGGSLGINIAC